jgi:hypothetical protein
LVGVVVILAIDPGKEGGLVLREDEGILFEPMPKCNGEVDLAKLRNWLLAHSKVIEIAVIERPGIRPGQAPQQCAKQWVHYGHIQGILMGLDIPFREVASNVWSKEFPHGVDLEDKHQRYTAIKKARRRIAKDLFPTLDLRASKRAKEPHSGIVDAMLIAEWYHRRHVRSS